MLSGESCGKEAPYQANMVLVRKQKYDEKFPAAFFFGFAHGHTTGFDSPSALWEIGECLRFACCRIVMSDEARAHFVAVWRSPFSFFAQAQQAQQAFPLIIFGDGLRAV